ncbi:MAG: nicotinamide riboside transporter PnuC [Oscillospiraceae bacterium]|nr:nicotinamide riboside transporter PnuC [Oscillospiraceae bacterium]
MDGIKKIIRAVKSLKWYEAVMCVIMLVISIYYAIKPEEGCPQWLAVINLISGLCGIMCVFLTAKVNRMNFPFAVVNTVVFIIYLFYFGIWATFWLELVVYMPLNIISWWRWSKHKDEDDELLAKAKKMSILQRILALAVIIGIAVLVHFVLSELAGDSWMKFAVNYGWNVTVMKWLDSFIFSIGIVASGLELFRFKEQYSWWIITDVIAVAQYAIKKDPVYTTKKAIYLVEAFIGYWNWNKLSKKNKSNE